MVKKTAKVVWRNRSGQPPKRLPGAKGREVKSLLDLPTLIGAALA
jgi:hypothetical protein